MGRLSATPTIARLFDHLVGTKQQCRRNGDAERLGRFQINYKLEPDCLDGG
jgi:hypothetical protein